MTRISTNYFSHLRAILVFVASLFIHLASHIRHLTFLQPLQARPRNTRTTRKKDKPLGMFNVAGSISTARRTYISKPAIQHIYSYFPCILCVPWFKPLTWQLSFSISEGESRQGECASAEKAPWGVAGEKLPWGASLV